MLSGSGESSDLLNQIDKKKLLDIVFEFSSSLGEPHSKRNDFVSKQKNCKNSQARK